MHISACLTEPAFFIHSLLTTPYISKPRPFAAVKISARSAPVQGICRALLFALHIQLFKLRNTRCELVTIIHITRTKKGALQLNYRNLGMVIRSSLKSSDQSRKYRYLNSVNYKQKLYSKDKNHYMQWSLGKAQSPQLQIEAYAAPALDRYFGTVSNKNINRTC